MSTCPRICSATPGDAHQHQGGTSHKKTQASEVHLLKELHFCLAILGVLSFERRWLVKEPHEPEGQDLPREAIPIYGPPLDIGS